MGVVFFLLALGAAFVGVLVLVFAVISKRAREARLLTIRGVEARAKVIRKLYRQHTKHVGFYGIIYEFTPPEGGKTYRKNVHLVTADDGKYVEGGDVPVYYMPGHPGVNALKEIVDATKLLPPERQIR